MTRAITLLAGVVVLVACGRTPEPAPNHPEPPGDSLAGPASLGAPRQVGDWRITVLGSTLEPPGTSAHERVVPTGPFFDGDLRFFVILGLERLGQDTPVVAGEIDVEAAGASGFRYRPGQGPACRGAGDLADVAAARLEAGIRTELCFSVDPADADSLVLRVRTLSGSAAPTLFYLQATSH